MPRKDIYHECVKIALEKDGWEVTNDPLQVIVDETTLYIDLGIEPVYFAEKDSELIAVEIKSFRLQSSITSMYEALGKFCIYKTALRLSESSYKLFLAVPESVYETFFQRRLIQEVIKEYKVNYLVYDIQTTEITKWIRH
jgi:hypothetical protein